MLSKHDLFHSGTGGEEGLNMHPLQNQWGLHCDAPADRHLISSVESSSVTQCSLEQVHSMTSRHTHTCSVYAVCCPYYDDIPETFTRQTHRVQGVMGKIN